MRGRRDVGETERVTAEPAPARAKGKAEPSHMVAALPGAMSTYMPSAAALRTD